MTFMLFYLYYEISVILIVAHIYFSQALIIGRLYSLCSLKGVTLHTCTQLTMEFNYTSSITPYPIKSSNIRGAFLPPVTHPQATYISCQSWLDKKIQIRIFV